MKCIRVKCSMVRLVGRGIAFAVEVHGLIYNPVHIMYVYIYKPVGVKINK